LITCRRNHGQDRAVRIVTGLRDGRQGVRIPAEARDLSLIRNSHTVLGLTKSPVQWVLDCFRGQRGQGIKLTHSYLLLRVRISGGTPLLHPPPYAFMEWLGTNLTFFYFKLLPCSECCVLYFWVIPRGLNFIRRRFGTLWSIFIGCVYRKEELLTPPMKMDQSVPKRQHIKFIISSCSHDL